MTQTEFLLIIIAPVALVISLISLWISFKTRREQRVPHALSKKLGVIAIVLEARSHFSDVVILCVRQMQRIGSIAPVDFPQNEERAQTAFEMALEKIELCDQMCVHIRAMNSEEFDEDPSFALSAEEMLIEASAESERQRENLLDLQMGNSS